MNAQIWNDWQKANKRFASLILSAANGHGSKEMQAFEASLRGQFDAQSPMVQCERVSFFALIGLIPADLLNLVELPGDEAAEFTLLSRWW
ncbi:hypothetical protein [Phyllobacterium chamaecytisi]|uniref:hypothetical protein n=1 Tax=Phyllobacterium chamaecytisi TaxID=2876082 RepID=UPI001CC930D8|nr:hypothetical protein [Phyllobacterium sp. KW56]MBZ9603224.1 hypothetical protein [Phyllobacterium sp. KW56]